VNRIYGIYLAFGFIWDIQATSSEAGNIAAHTEYSTSIMTKHLDESGYCAQLFNLVSLLAKWGVFIM
jgi:hypothetical protein